MQILLSKALFFASQGHFFAFRTFTWYHYCRRNQSSCGWPEARGQVRARPHTLSLPWQGIDYTIWRFQCERLPYHYARWFFWYFSEAKSWNCMSSLFGLWKSTPLHIKLFSFLPSLHFCRSYGKNLTLMGQETCLIEGEFHFTSPVCLTCRGIIVSRGRVNSATLNTSKRWFSMKIRKIATLNLNKTDFWYKKKHAKSEQNWSLMKNRSEKNIAS